jgi:enoyl-CoA hydratase/carnithine racemase
VTSGTVLYEPAPPVGYVTLNRPEAGNAMNDALLRDLAAAIRQAGADPGTRVVVLRGAGRGFCAGEDVKAAAERRALDEYRRNRLAAEQEASRAIRQLDKPVLAALHGFAVGGGLVFAMLCDMRFAAEGTRLELPEVRVGATASLGGVYQLARIVGLGRAFELLLGAEPIEPAEAHRIGLVNRVVAEDRLADEVRAWATRIAGHFPLEVALMRRALYRELDLDFDAALDAETEAAFRSYEGGARVEGMRRALAEMRRRREQAR